MSLYSDQLYKAANPQASSLSSALAVNYTIERGRHIVAVEDIPPGALILDEVPYACTLYDQCCPYFCQFCLEPLPDQPLLCQVCNDTSNQYCSASCRDRSWQAHHQHECGPIRLLLKCVGLRQHSVLLALRTLLQTPVELICDEYAKLMVVAAAAAEGRPAPQHGSLPQHTFSTRADHFATVMSLLADDECSPVLPPVAERSGLAKLCSFIVDKLDELDSPILRDNAGWAADVDRAERVLTMQTVLLAIMKRLSRNRQGMLEHKRMQRPEVVELFAKELESHKASGLYPTGALLNHACVPNVHMLFGPCGRMLARTITTVKAGESIAHCYGPKFGRHPRAERRRQLQADYCFGCDCQACTSDECLAIEREMQSVKCPSCASDCYVPDPNELDQENDETPLECSLCGAALRPVLDEIEGLAERIRLQLQSHVPQEDAPQLLACMQLLESKCHTHHKQCNDLRALVGSLLTNYGVSEPAEPLLLRHVATCKRQSGPLSLRTALALSRLTQVYRESGSDKFWLTAAVMIRIHLAHYGAAQVRLMFEQNQLTHFLPAIDMIQAGAV